MPKNRPSRTRNTIRTVRKSWSAVQASHVVARIALFATCGTLAFGAGFWMTNDVDPVATIDAQASETTQVNVILQYQPVGGGAPQPIEITPFMNNSQSALLQLQEIHSGAIEPPVDDRCRTTNALGRCNISNVPVGEDAAFPGVDRQYDIVVDTVFIEFLTGIPLETTGAFIPFDPDACSGTTTAFSGDAWCLTQSNGSFAPEYFVTITLNERDVCTGTTPPAPFCDVNGEKVDFVCNPSYTGSTSPWEPVASSCGTVQCPDGNPAPGMCDEVTAGLAMCSTAAACVNNQLCAVRNFSSTVEYDAGIDEITIRGERFGAAGGTVTFQTESGEETVQIFPGSDWTDTEIHVHIPQNAVSGELRIHPNSHGFTEESNGTLTPVTCDSPPATIRSLIDQFSILSVSAQSADGVRLVSPGFETMLTVLAQHNDAVGRFDHMTVELVDGAYPDPDALPLNRTLITQSSCDAEITGSTQAKQATLECSILVPQSATQFPGPYTFIVTLYDDTGGSQTAVLLDSGQAVLAGDFNMDGLLDLQDAVIARRIADGSLMVTDEHLQRDTNDDNAITQDDVLFVLHTLTQ